MNDDTMIVLGLVFHRADLLIWRNRELRITVQHRSDPGRYVAWVVGDLSGCLKQGVTPDEAVRAILPTVIKDQKEHVDAATERLRLACEALEST